MCHRLTTLVGLRTSLSCCNDRCPRSGMCSGAVMSRRLTFSHVRGVPGCLPLHAVRRTVGFVITGSRGLCLIRFWGPCAQAQGGGTLSIGTGSEAVGLLN